MKKIATLFPHLCVSYICDVPMQEIITLIEQKLNEESVTENILLAKEKHALSFSIKKRAFLERNSFLPTVDIKVCEVENRTTIICLFSLQRPIKVFISTFAILAAMLEIVLIGSYMLQSMRIGFPLLILPILLLFIFLISLLGLRINSKPIIQMIDSVCI